MSYLPSSPVPPMVSDRLSADAHVSWSKAEARELEGAIDARRKQTSASMAQLHELAPLPDAKIGATKGDEKKPIQVPRKSHSLDAQLVVGLKRRSRRPDALVVDNDVSRDHPIENFGMEIRSRKAIAGVVPANAFLPESTGSEAGGR